MTAGEKTRLHSEPFGVRQYVPERLYQGYTLFSPAWGDREYLIDMRGLVVHTWEITHSNVAELLPDGNLFTHNCGRWLDELTPDSQAIWRWEGDDSLVSPNHHDFWVGDEMIVSLAAKHEPVIPGVYEPGTEPDQMRTDLILKINRNKEVVWRFSFGDHVEALCALSGYPMPFPYMRRARDGSFVPIWPSRLGSRQHDRSLTGNRSRSKR